MTEKVITAALNSAKHCGDRRDYKADVAVALLIPKGDPLKMYENVVDIVEGDEHDVLSRYHAAFAKHNPKYIVRLTGDCPDIKPAMITKIIDTARSKQADYVSNCGEEWRTSADGHDVEIMSARMFLWNYENAETPEEREHVTIAIKRRAPKWAVRGACLYQVDNSDQKWSVDEPQDLAIQRERDARMVQKTKIAKMTHNFVVWF
jgi:spore coat polysaccharide biosynthesis protein SpsF (cytidylyltransferase family)